MLLLTWFGMAHRAQKCLNLIFVGCYGLSNRWVVWVGRDCTNRHTTVWRIVLHPLPQPFKYLRNGRFTSFQQSICQKMQVTLMTIFQCRHNHELFRRIMFVKRSKAYITSGFELGDASFGKACLTKCLFQPIGNEVFQCSVPITIV